MKKLLLNTVLGLTLLSFAGCTETEKTTTKEETAVMKCETGKCGAAMEKTEVPTQKPSADAEGKCGDK